MVGTNTWKLLELGQDLPRLLIKTRFDDDGYDIQLTDLSRIWSESLKHEAIVGRAAEKRCSIDPSENDQYGILLDKIDGAITGAKGTAIELHYNDGENDLTLDLSAPLPGSLPPLKWSICFEQRRPSEFAYELVRPLLQQANHLRHQIQFLLDEVTAKDRVISKITDRLESSGNDLTTVFPGVSNIKTNRKRSQREQLAAHVKGLADFDETTWRASIAPKIDHFEVSPNLLNDLLSDLPTPASSDFNKNASEDWWKRLGRGQQGKIEHETRDARNGGSQHGSSMSAQSKLSEDEGVEEDEFQKQETPPHLKNQSRAHTRSAKTLKDNHSVLQSFPTAITDDDETEDDEDLDAVRSHTSSLLTRGRSQQETSQRPAVRPTSNLGDVGGNMTMPSREADVETELEHEARLPPSKRKGKLGAIGGKEASPPPEPERKQQEESTPPGTKQKAKLGAFGGRKRSTTPETEDEEGVGRPLKRKSKLGTFGGRQKEHSSSSWDHAADDQSPLAKPKLGTFGGKAHKSSQQHVGVERAESPAVSPAKHKLGVIGGKASAKTTESPSPLAQNVEKVSEEREVDETPEERANRKRERLKKEMQEKHPVKKKRKF